MADQTEWEIGQVGITVSDLEKSVAFYRDQVGLPFLFQAPNVALFDCGGVRLLLGLNERPDRKPFGTVIYFRTSDLKAGFEELKGRGVPVASEPHLIARLADFDLWMAFFRDPDENIFALMAEIREGRPPSA